MRALRHPALGLVLVVLGVSALPKPLVSLANVLILDRDFLPGNYLGMLVAQLAVAILQVSTGWAVISGRAPAPWFAAYVAACIGLTAASALLVLGEEVSPMMIVGLAFETLGMPALIVIASVLYPADAFDDDRSPLDVMAMLLVLAVRTLIMTPLDVVNTTRMLAASSTTSGSWVGMFIWPAISITLAIIALIAVRRSTRGALRLYVVAAIGVHVAMSLLSVVWMSVEGTDSSYRPVLLANQFLGLVTILTPLALWMYAPFASEPAPARAPSRVPIWIALSYVPTLLARVFLADEITAQWGGRSTSFVIAIAATVAAILVATADAAFRRRPSARWWTLAAAIGGVGLVGAAVYVVFTLERPFGASAMLAPMGNLVGSTLVAGWLYRR